MKNSHFKFSPDLYSQWVSGVLFPLHEVIKGHASVSVRKAMERTQWFSSSEIKELQLGRLRQLLLHVQRYVPFYRDLFDRIGFAPEKITVLSELEVLPLLDKQIIRTHLDALKSTNTRKIARFNTGGSSGEPLVFFIGKERVSHDIAAKWRATRWWGVDIGDPEIVVWGSPIELGAQDGLRAWRDRLFRTTLLSAFEMSDARVAGFIETIRCIRPKMLFGYPSAISHIAAHADKAGIALNDLGIRVVFVTAERLYDNQREQIASTFGCPVANGYGGRDSGFIAHECPAGGMHITAEDIIIEIVDASGRTLPPGELGEIVVTHLATGDFPFIRYRTGDMGVLDDKTCDCGRGLPLLREIQGRSTDFVVARDGTVMHGLALIYILREMPQLKVFKIVQESLDLTRVMVVAESKLSAVEREKIITGFQSRLGRDVRIEVEQLAEIEAEKSGKFRYIISRVVP
ncbi:MAG: hypothetical protein RI993_1717 [Pseudomonadota bacterium]|jgi:phenylacetate-CoA ligase